MVGYAVTVKVDSTTPALVPDRSRLSGLLAAVAQAPRPCVVVCEEAGPSPERGCHMGDLVATMLARHGVVGAVSGSGVQAKELHTKRRVSGDAESAYPR